MDFKAYKNVLTSIKVGSEPIKMVEGLKYRFKA
jgi:hypothetical protein